MRRSRVVVSIETKRTALERMKRGEAASAIAADLGVDRRRLYAWQAAVRRRGLAALRGPGRPPRAIVADGAGRPFLAEFKMQELVDRDPRRSTERPDGPQ